MAHGDREARCLQEQGRSLELQARAVRHKGKVSPTYTRSDAFKAHQKRDRICILDKKLVYLSILIMYSFCFEFMSNRPSSPWCLHIIMCTRQFTQGLVVGPTLYAPWLFLSLGVCHGTHTVRCGKSISRATSLGWSGKTPLCMGTHTVAHCVGLLPMDHIWYQSST